MLITQIPPLIRSYLNSKRQHRNVNARERERERTRNWGRKRQVLFKTFCWKFKLNRVCIMEWKWHSLLLKIQVFSYVIIYAKRACNMKCLLVMKLSTEKCSYYAMCRMKTTKMIWVLSPVVVDVCMRASVCSCEIFFSCYFGLGKIYMNWAFCEFSGASQAQVFLALTI